MQVTITRFTFMLESILFATVVKSMHHQNDQSKDLSSKTVADGTSSTFPGTSIMYNEKYREFKGLKFTNGFRFPESLNISTTTARAPDGQNRQDGVRNIEPKHDGPHRDGEKDEELGLKNSGGSCSVGSAVEPDCSDTDNLVRIRSYFPPRAVPSAHTQPVSFLTTIDERMTRQKCGLYCVLQNYPFANYLDNCEMCLCGAFLDKNLFSAKETEKSLESVICINGTDLVGIGLNTSIYASASQPITPTGSPEVHALNAAEQYELRLRVWHWNKLSFITIATNLGNDIDAIVRNQSVQIAETGFGSTTQKIKYQTPGLFRLRVVADDGFQEGIQELMIEVVPAVGKAVVVVSPGLPRVKETILFHVPAFAANAENNIMWFFQDPVSFAESTAVSPSRTYDEPGVYRTDVSVSSARTSQTGSVDVVVEGPLEGLHIFCAATTEVNRIISITVKVDNGTNYRFLLDNGLEHTSNIESSSGRYRVLYPEPGLYDLTVIASNPVSRLQSSFSIRVEEPEIITIPGFEVPDFVVVDEPITFTVSMVNETAQQYVFEWEFYHFSDKMLDSGNGLVSVTKTFFEIDTVHIRLTITGPKGGCKVLHRKISVVRRCVISPDRGTALLTEFRLKCVTPDDEQSHPTLDAQTVKILSEEVGSIDVVYSVDSRGMILPDTMSNKSAMWTLVFPDNSLGHCGISGMNKTCDLAYNVTLISSRNNTVDNLLQTMSNIVDEKQPEEASVLSVLIAQFFIMAKRDPSAVSLFELSSLLSKICRHVVDSQSARRNLVVSVQLHNLLESVLGFEDLMFLREDAIAVLDFLAFYVAEVPRHGNLSAGTHLLFPLVEKILNAAVGLPGQTSNGPPVRFLKPLSIIVASAIRESSRKTKFVTNDVMVSATIVNISTAQSILHSEGVTVSLPVETMNLLASLDDGQVTVVVAKCRYQCWPSHRHLSDNSTDAKNSGKPFNTFFVTLLHLNFDELFPMKNNLDNALRLRVSIPVDERSDDVMPNSAIQPRVDTALPAPSGALGPHHAVRYRLLLSKHDGVPEHFFLTVSISTNSSAESDGRVHMYLLDDSDTLIETGTFTYTEVLSQGRASMRLSFPSARNPRALSFVNEGSLHILMTAELMGLTCNSGEPRDLTGPGTPRSCQPDASIVTPGLRTCSCDNLSAFTGQLFDFKEFYAMEKEVDLRKHSRSAIAGGSLIVVSILYILGLITIGIHHKKTPQASPLSQVSVMGKGEYRADVLFWSSDRPAKGATKLQLLGPGVRIEQILHLQEAAKSAEDLSACIRSDKPIPQIASVRITGRVADSSFPFKRITVRLFTPTHSTNFCHFRLSAPRLLEDTRDGVMFELTSQAVMFSSRKLASLEFKRRLVEDHLWIRTVRKKDSAVGHVEALSVAVTALFTFMGVCSLGFTLTLRKDQALDLTRPFRLHSSDCVLGLWTALLVTPLITIVLEILNRCQRRLALTSPSSIDDPGHRSSAGNSALASANPHSQATRSTNAASSPLGVIPEDTTLPNASSSANPDKSDRTKVEGSSSKTGSFGHCGSPIIRRLLAYVLCFTMSSQSVCLVLIFGLMYTPALSLRWLVSVGSAFASSFCVLEPLKIIGKSIWVSYTRTEVEYFSKMFFKCSRGIKS